MFAILKSIIGTVMLISYTAICLVCTLALCVQALLVHENNRFDQKKKHIFYRTYLVIALSGISEWGGVFLNYAPDNTRWLHILMKFIDYTVSPTVAMCFARQVKEATRSYRVVNAVIAVNIIFQVINIFTGWAFYLDAENVYHHGQLHWIYDAIYIFTALFGYMEFIEYGKKFRRQNTGSMSMVLATVLLCLILQTIGDDVRTVYLGMTLCTMLLFVHYTEFGQIEKDDELSLKKQLLENDAMTGVFSRYAYIEAVEAYTNAGIPENLAIFMADVNGLKTINDLLGHSAGDEVIKAVANCLKVTFEHCGKCYRTGGDEFVVFARMTREGANAAQDSIKAALKRWHGMVAPEAHASVGYVMASDFPDHTLEELVTEADVIMYEDKKRYYESVNAGNTMRHNRSPIER
jgi:diguanylate cyclase (GGDEF)-like protein